jgi:tRNA dimethylallyltransferase
VPLRDRIAVRAERMLKLGWPEEVAALAREVPPDAVAWKACGYAAMRGYVEGRLSRAAALEQITISTRQYAKRQRTWFRHQLRGDRVTRLNPDDADAVPRAMAWLRRHTPSPVGVP